VTAIDDRAFGGCVSLASFTFPNSVTSIGEGVFGWCGLTNIVIGNGVTSIGGYAFQYCTSLATATISPSVTTIGDFAFADCLNLTAINVDATNPAFMSAAGVLFNASQTALIQYPIGNGATSYTIPNGVTSIGDGAFDHCTNLASITIPNSVTTIGTNAFNSCLGLKNLAIGNGVVSIGDGAFDLCSNLASVTLPASVTSIGAQAFSYCTNLKAIYFLGNAPSTNANGGQFFENTTTVYYLSGTTGWTTKFAGMTTSKIYGVTFSATPTNGVTPLTVNFTAGSTDSGGNTISSWNWAFGDGSTTNVQSPSHTYATAGTFLPALFATNSSGTRVLGVSSVTISVSPPPSLCSCCLSGANLVLNGSNGFSGTTYYVLMSTDLTLPVSQWMPVATNVLGASGNFTITVTNTVSQDVPQRFYVLQSP
jgi:PKD repeat protein